MTFFNLPLGPFPLGPVLLTVDVGAGGAVGASLRITACVLSMKLTAELIPWGAVDIWGMLSAQILMFLVQIELTGRILQTKVPVTATVGFQKFPLRFGLRMDLEVVPIAFILKGYIKIGIKIFGKTIAKTILSGTIWQWSSNAINTNIFNIEPKEDDPSPPKFLATESLSPKGRAALSASSLPATCSVAQVPGLPAGSPELELKFQSFDADSNMTVTYSIGTSPGATNLVQQRVAQGSVVRVPTDALSPGVPHHFTVSAVNTDGQEAELRCALDGHVDYTLPVGRIDVPFALTSNPTTLRGEAIVVDTTPLQNSIVAGVASAPALGTATVFARKATTFRSVGIGGYGPVLPQSPVQRAGVSRQLRQGISRSRSRRSAGDSALDGAFELVPVSGRLQATPLFDGARSDQASCAATCGDNPDCLSYSFGAVDSRCITYSTVWGSAKLLREPQRVYRERRLPTRETKDLVFRGTERPHGSLAYLTLQVKNDLGYSALVSSVAIRVDKTPPMPDIAFGRERPDAWSAKGCSASLLDDVPCVEPTKENNHVRLLADEEADVLFPGLEAAHHASSWFTRHAILVEAAWLPFIDVESGIRGYIWGAGSTPCSDDVIAFSDPHEELGTHQDDWTHSALAYPVGDGGAGLPEGPYYLTVQVRGACNRVCFFVPPLGSGLACVSYFSLRVACVPTTPLTPLPHFLTSLPTASCTAVPLRRCTATRARLSSTSLLPCSSSTAAPSSRPP